MLNLDANLIYVSARLQTFRDGDVPLVIQEVQPAVVDLSKQADTARQILSQPLKPYSGCPTRGFWTLGI